VITATSEPTAGRTLPPPPAEEPTAEEIEGLKALVKEPGYELLVWRGSTSVFPGWTSPDS
jgi:hypothetical protein